MNRFQYLLSKLAEEASEVAQITLKTAQFGFESTKPGQPFNNQIRMHDELTDLNTIIYLLNKEFNFGYDGLQDPDVTATRVEKVEKFYNIAVQLGTVKE